jgi:hypothetical protein
MRKRIAAPIAAALLALSLAVAGPVTAGASGNVVLDWNQYAVEAIFNAPIAEVPGAGQSATVGAIHLAMVQIAVYDAVNAIAGRYEPYLTDLPDAPRKASKKAAVAVAAHDVLVGLGTRRDYATRRSPGRDVGQHPRGSAQTRREGDRIGGRGRDPQRSCW